jgi:hypothetical protein
MKLRHQGVPGLLQGPGHCDDSRRCLDIAATLQWCGEPVTEAAIKEQFYREQKRTPDLGLVRAAVAKHSTRED